MADDGQQRESALAGSRAAHALLLADLSTLTDDQARSASALPGWSVGHVLTHIARNGDSYTRMMTAAMNGECVTQYDGGIERRAADIEAGAPRPAAELVADVAGSIARLERTWERMTPLAWRGHGLNAAGQTWPCEAMPFHRWREVTVHHTDLDLGYSVAQWPVDYVERELAIGLRGLAERLTVDGRRRTLAWLLGRGEQPGGLELAPWQSRPNHYLC
ncbi:MAG TPA: maleylpyruvate isomerase family mycothiol-dependent enzyme [Mycobacteriales bacterium]|nr:maleylpyruvate isomerase family mycothiol-dependent enzyme [Mycobacteriales bacterium]